MTELCPVCDAYTDEEPDLNDEVFVGSVDVDEQGVVVSEHRQKEGSIADNFFELCIPILTDAAKTQEDDDVETVAFDTITQRGLHKVFHGSGLTFDISCEYRLNGSRTVVVWLRSRINRRIGASSPIHWMME